ncbi:MAG: response regulator [Gammaproteobacteria bacterium]|nr:response regulator [Gammaproteobacteria bacterium]
MAKSFLTPNQVAELLMVSPVTVRQWAQKGLIEARTTAGGHRRFSMDAVRKFARENSIQLPDEHEPRLLIVDDNVHFNGFLNAYFQNLQSDLEVATAFDGFDAGAKVQALKPTIILLDIMMPGIDGVEVCKRIKANPETAHALVIAMTGHYSSELETEVLAAGATVLLRKPFAMNELLAACGLSAPASPDI